MFFLYVDCGGVLGWIINAMINLFYVVSIILVTLLIGSFVLKGASLLDWDLIARIGLSMMGLYVAREIIREWYWRGR